MARITMVKNVAVWTEKANGQVFTSKTIIMMFTIVMIIIDSALAKFL